VPTAARERARTVATLCFARARSNESVEPLDASALAPEIAAALANTLPFLLCGEESAVHAFGRRLAGAASDREAAALAVITADEVRHADWLAALAKALPCADAAPDSRAMAAFFRRLLTRDRALHFARVAALDLLVCEILKPLVARGTPLAASSQVLSGLRAIRRDEARHVRIARDCARRLGFEAEQQLELDRSMRAALARVLAPVGPSLARLGVVGFGQSCVSQNG
jgi:hypothetical protein